MPPQPKQGTVPFDCPAAGKPCETWYKIFGDLSNGKTPLVGVHGGPGLSHNYMLCLQRLTVEHDIPVILYDQIGNGQSTHLQEKNGDLAFWNEELFHDELTNLLEKLGVADNYSYLGHSWGGMMGATFAAKQPAGLKKLILANAPASTKAWCAAYESYKALMPKEIKDVLDKGTATQNFETPEYKDAVAQFSGKFMMPYPWPQDLLDSFEWGEKDPTVYATGFGPDEFNATGSFANWSAVDVAKNIKAPTLVINGTNEGASDEAIKPFLDVIPNVKYIKFAKSAHMPMFEEPDEFFKVVSDFLAEN